jgi:hypothetical protein
MDLADPFELPLPPGTSPFGVKGHVYVAFFRYCDDQVPGGAKPTIAALEDSRLREFLSQRFLAGSFYDIMPILPAAASAALRAGEPLIQFMRRFGAHRADHDIPGIYKLALKLSSPEATVVRSPRLAMQYFNFGTVSSRVVQPGCCETLRTGVPGRAAHWYAATVEGFTPKVLERTGARNTRVRTVVVGPDGQKAGIETVTLKFVTTWSE